MGILNAAPNPTIDVRSFYSGRRFVCLGGLFALFLIAPISLSAQTGSSAQPPQPNRNRKGRVRLLAPTLPLS